MIKLQLLDYIYDNDGQNQVNFNNATSFSGWQVVSSEKIIIPSGSGTRYIYPVMGELVANTEYRIELTLSDKGGTAANELGFSSVGVDGAANGIGSTFRRSTNGTTSGTFTSATSGTGSNPKIFAETNTSGTITAKIMLNTGVNITKSVIGDLDVGQSSDFPFALNFSIADVRNIEERTGSFSKTFNIPATKNNNKILKGFYFTGSYIEGNTLTTQKKCRVIFDGLNEITGTLQITEVAKSDSPSYYACVFYGDNIEWAQSVGNKKLKDLSVYNGAAGSGWDNLNGKGAGTGQDLKIQYNEIKDSWFADNADEMTPFVQASPADYWNPTVTNNNPVVYPLINPGKFGGQYWSVNSGDQAGDTVQLYKTYEQQWGGSGKNGYWGYTGGGSSYGTNVPQLDWRPGIFIYDIIHQIFSQEGFKIDSTFIESAMFKQLIMLLPNFTYNNSSEREKKYGYRLTFYDGGATMDNFQTMQYVRTTASTGTLWIQRDIKFNQQGIMLPDPYYTSTIYSDTYGTFTFDEYGFYNVSLQNISFKIIQACQGSIPCDDTDFIYVQLLVRVKTVGESSYKEIQNEYIFSSSDGIAFDCSTVNPSATGQYMWDLPNINFDRYFNKGDTLQFQLKWRLEDGDAGACTQGFTAHMQPGQANEYYDTNTQDGEVAITFLGDKAEYGQTYDLKNIIPDSYTQLEFLRGVFHAFNLQVRTDVDERKVYIEPYNDFYKPLKDAIDWSHKLDLSQNQVSKFIDTNLKQQVIFKYKTDSSDKKVEARGIEFFEGIKDEFPYKETLPNDFPQGTTIYENPFFAGTCTTTSTTTKNGTLWSAVLWDNCSTGSAPNWNGNCRPPQKTSFLPRLLFWSKMECRNSPVQTAGGWSFYWTKWVNTISSNTGFNDGNVSLGRTIPQAVSRNLKRPIVNNSGANVKGLKATPLLSYGSTEQGYCDCDNANSQNSLSNNSTMEKGLYQVYYEKMINQLKTSPKILIAYFNLNVSDITNLDLSYLVYVNGYYYRINKIIDYNADSNSTTRVELVEWSISGETAARKSFSNTGYMK